MPLLIGAAAMVLVVIGGGVAGVNWWLDKPNRDYISALKASGDFGDFASEAEAIAHAKSVCAGLEAGGKAQGSHADLAATQSYCPKFSDGFHVLEAKVIEGSFDLVDTSYSPYYTGIDTSGSGCEGSGGYSDIQTGTTVTVKNGAGKFLASTSLSKGSGTSTRCTFAFSVSLTEGEDDYVISVSHRGDTHYTWASLTGSGINLTLGS